MALRADSSPDPVAVNLQKDLLHEIPWEANSCDQPTATDQPVIRAFGGDTTGSQTTVDETKTNQY